MKTTFSILALFILAIFTACDPKTGITITNDDPPQSGRGSSFCKVWIVCGSNTIAYKILASPDRPIGGGVLNPLANKTDTAIHIEYAFNETVQSKNIFTLNNFEILAGK